MSLFTLSVGLARVSPPNPVLALELTRRVPTEDFGRFETPLKRERWKSILTLCFDITLLNFLLIVLSFDARSWSAKLYLEDFAQLQGSTLPKRFGLKSFRPRDVPILRQTDRQLSQHLKVDLADECHYARKQLALEKV